MANINDELLAELREAEAAYGREIALEAKRGIRRDGGKRKRELASRVADARASVKLAGEAVEKTNARH